jgi:hypothetical protein
MNKHRDKIYQIENQKNLADLWNRFLNGIKKIIHRIDRQKERKTEHNYIHMTSDRLVELKS